MEFKTILGEFHNYYILSDGEVYWLTKESGLEGKIGYALLLPTSLSSYQLLNFLEKGKSVT